MDIDDDPNEPCAGGELAALELAAYLICLTILATVLVGLGISKAGGIIPAANIPLRRSLAFTFVSAWIFSAVSLLSLICDIFLGGDDRNR